jgi:hypothetical protein
MNLFMENSGIIQTTARYLLSNLTLKAYGYGRPTNRTVLKDLVYVHRKVLSFSHGLTTST